jgi:winged helix DNA-binding protein
VLRERLTAQLLAGPPARDPVGVAERLLAVQGQDPRGFRLAVRVRTSGLTAADVDRALTEERSLVVTWLNRGTLHLARSEDHPWLLALTAPQILPRNLRRLGQLGIDGTAADRGVAAIERSLAAEGPLSREQLRERMASAGVDTTGQATIHLIELASLRGVAVRGPVVDGAHAYVLVRDWIGEPRAVDREAALAELARRYLAGHGPADERDLARWSGLPVRQVRAGLAAIASELDQRSDGLVDLASRPPPAELPPPRLLGGFDPVLLGWASREPVVGEHQAAITLSGIFRPFALVGGRAAGTWTMPGGRVQLKPFGRLRKADAEALEEDAADVVRFLSAA